MVSTNAAVFVAADMNAVTELGAPWYTSRPHWNGAAETLNARPAMIIARPATNVVPALASAIWAKPNCSVAP